MRQTRPVVMPRSCRETRRQDVLHNFEAVHGKWHNTRVVPASVPVGEKQKLVLLNLSICEVTISLVHILKEIRLFGVFPVQN